MIDFNNKAQLNRIKAIKGAAGWNEYTEYVLTRLQELKDMEKINSWDEFLGHKIASKFIEDILLFIK